jgi:hypothetical protein
MFSQRHITAEQLDKKTTLTNAEFVASLSREEQAGVLEIINLFEPERRMFKNMLRLFFTVAGFSWFFIFFPNLTDLPGEKLAAFRVNQYQIYLILLTLWGFELKMQEKRLSFLLNLSSALGKKWYHITRQDVVAAGKMYLFDLFSRRAKDGTFLPVAFVWLLIALVAGCDFVRIKSGDGRERGASRKDTKDQGEKVEEGRKRHCREQRCIELSVCLVLSVVNSASFSSGNRLSGSRQPIFRYLELRETKCEEKSR